MPGRPPGYEGRFDVIGWYLVRRVVGLRRTLGRPRPRLLDLGMGRGRDLIYFSRRGFRTLGVDISPAGLEKAKRRAARLDTPIRTRLADIRSLRLNERFDVVYSSTTMNYLQPRLRAGRFARYRTWTRPGGIHAVNAFTSDDGWEAPPDVDPNVQPFRPGELLGYYRGWRIIESRDFDYDCRFGGPAHQHTVDVVIARRPS